MSIIRATLLGCGSSGGVPRPNGDWGACDPANPKNRRRRCSLLIEVADKIEELERGTVTRIVIDTSPDFREQMLSAGVDRLDAVLITHDHADQTHGIDDLRPYVLYARKQMPVWMDTETRRSLENRFDYVFRQRPGSHYPAILEARDLPEYGQAFEIDGPGGRVSIIPVELEHGKIKSVGYRIGDLVYAPDVSAIPQPSFAEMANADIWIIDALRDKPHATHANVEQALEWLSTAQVRRGILTNMHIDLDYNELSARLPENVEPGFDGMQIYMEGMESA